MPSAGWEGDFAGWFVRRPSLKSHRKNLTHFQPDPHHRQRLLAVLPPLGRPSGAEFLDASRNLFLMLPIFFFDQARH
jgi:hypothetical protein